VPTATDTEQSRHRISRLLLEERGGIRLSPQLEHERRSALFDLLEDNRFVLVKGRPGPYTVRLGIEAPPWISIFREELLENPEAGQVAEPTRLEQRVKS